MNLHHGSDNISCTLELLAEFPGQWCPVPVEEIVASSVLSCSLTWTQNKCSTGIGGQALPSVPNIREFH